jgi:hypothetical protein
MSRLRALFVLLPAVLLLGGCGGSKHSSTPSSAPHASATSSTASPATATTTTASSTTVTTTASPPDTTGAAATSGATNVRVPSIFTIHAGGRLTPSTVSTPAFIALDVSVSSADGRSHRVVIHTPTPHTLTVPANGHASVFIPGLKQGRYVIAVDGKTRGALLIGGEPGP